MDFVVILTTVFSVTIDVADAFHCINVIARELRDRGNLIPFPSIRTVWHYKGVVYVARCHPCEGEDPFYTKVPRKNAGLFHLNVFLKKVRCRLS